MKQKAFLRSLILSSSALLATATNVISATLTWDSDLGTSGVQESIGTFTWAPADKKFWNGTGNVAPADDTSTDIARFGNGATLASSPVINLSTRSINGLIFGPNLTSGYNVTASSPGEELTLGSSGITVTLGAQATTVGSANLGLKLGAAQAWTNNSTTLLTVGGAVDNGAHLLTIGGTGNTTVSGAIGTGAGGLTKIGGGTLTLSGANGYTGTTTINSGVLTLRSQTGSLSSGSALTFGGSGTFNMDNTGASGALSQSLGALTFSAGDGTVQISRTAAQNQTITFASLAARTAGATGNFVNAGGTNGASNGFMFTTAPTSGQIIDSGLFFNGSAYAAYDAGGFVRALAYGTDTNANAALSGNANTTLGTIGATIDTRFNGATTTTTTASAQAAASTLTVANGAAFKVGQAITGTGITANTYVTGISGNVLTLSVATGTVAANAVVTPYTSVSAQTTGSVNTLHLNGNGAVLSLDPSQTLSINGILRTGHTANTFSGINGGTGIQSVASGGEMVIRTDLAADTLFIATPILDNGGSSLTKTGAGTLNLTGTSSTNTYTGSTYVNAGTLTGSGIRTASTTYVESGATILPSNNASFTQLHLRGGTLNVSNGSTAIAGTVTLASNTTSFLTSGGTTTLSANIGGAGDLRVNTNSRQLYLTGTNDYSGTTTLLTPVGTGAVVFGTPGSLYGGDTTKWTPGNITVASGAALGIRGGTGGFTSAQVGALLGNMTTSDGNGLLAGSNIFFDANGGFNYSGAITDSTGATGGSVGVMVFGSTLTLSGNNTYTGATVFRPYNVNAVGLSVASFNSVNGGNPLLASSSLGAPTTVSNGTIQMGTDSFQSSHTLTYTGSGETTDRVLNINGNGSSIMTISQSGSGLLKFTSPVTKTGGATNYTPIVLTGGGNGEFATGLPGFGNFTKSGTGTWTIGGSVGSASTAGTKTISAGTLVFRAGGFNTTGATTISGANTAFLYNAASDATLSIGGNLTLTGGTNTTIGGSIGSTATSARINFTGSGAATSTVKVNIYGINGVTPLAGTNDYTLLQSASGTLDGATYSLGTVYNNTNFTVGGTIGESATTVTASITRQNALTGNVYWNGGLAGNAAVWAASNGSTQSNWATDLAGAATPLVPGSGADVVIATTSPTVSPAATTLGSDMSIKSLTISNTLGLGLNASGVDSYKLTIGTGGITMDSGVDASSIAVPLGLGGNQTWTNNSANALTVSGIVSGSGNLTIAGTGTTVLSGASTYTGKTSITGGTLSINRIFSVNAGSSAVGAPTTAANGTIAIGSGSTGATLAYTGLAATTDRVIDLAGTTGGATLDQSGTGLLKFTSAFTATGVGSKTLTLQGSTSGSGEISGAIANNSGTDTTSLVKQGTGTWTLSGANTYTGTTDVTGGALLINGSTSTGLVSVGAAGTLGGIGTVGGATTVNGILSPGQVLGGSPGTMTFQNTLGLAGSTIMEIDGSMGPGVTGGNDFVNLTGAAASGLLTYGGTMTLDIGTVFGEGIYSWNLFDFASESSTFTGITLADQYSGTLTDSGGGVWGFTDSVNTWTFTESDGILGLTVVVPEPSTALLGAIGALLLLRRRR